MKHKTLAVIVVLLIVIIAAAVLCGRAKKPICQPEPVSETSKGEAQRRYASKQDAVAVLRQEEDKKENTTPSEVGPAADERSAVEQQQDRVVVSGQIKGADLKPLSNVLVSLTSGGAMTDEHGNFRIEYSVGVSQENREVYLKIVAPSQSFFVKKKCDVASAQPGTTLDVGGIVIPFADDQTGIKGTVVGDKALFPQYLMLTSVDSPVVAVLPLRDDIFGGQCYPSGDYVLSNTTPSGRTLPKEAQTCQKRVSLAQGETLEVTFEIEAR